MCGAPGHRGGAPWFVSGEPEPGLRVGVDWELGAKLVVRAQQGDTLALSELLDLVSPFVLTICRAIAGAGAEDAAQEALIVVFRRLGNLREPAALRGWLRTVCTREALRVTGDQNKPTLGLEQAGQLTAPGPAPELYAAMVQALASLPPEQRAALVLREVEGLREAEIARLLAAPLGTVKSRLHRARARFREAFTR